MSRNWIRRLDLPVDQDPVARAQQAVRTLMVNADLAVILDDALLLTSALVGNGAMREAEETYLSVTVDPFGVAVAVTGRVAPEPAVSGGNGRGGGYGLTLIDRIATEWGRSRHANGQSIWFRLNLPGARSLPVEVPGTGFGAIQALLAVDATPDDTGSLHDFTHSLLHCLTELLGAVGCVVVLDRADGDGPRHIAQAGPDITGVAMTHRTALPVSRPWSGELLVAAPASPHAAALSMLVAERLGLALENERLRVADLRRQARLTFLAEVSELLAQSLDIELTMALIPRLIVAGMGEWCAVFTTDRAGGLRLTGAAHADETMMPWLLAALEQGQGEVDGGLRLFADTVGPAEAVRAGGHLSLSVPSDGFAVPLIARGQWLGALAVGRGSEHRYEDEVTIAEEVARRAAVAIDNARIHDERRQIAHTLQQALLPSTLPQIDGIELSAQYVPSGEGTEVGGDFYDVLPMPDGGWLALVGDVCGKGVPAATTTGLVRNTIRILAREGRQPTSALATLNDILLEQSVRHCTLALALVSRPVAPEVPGRLQVSLHLAGHEQPLLVRAGGEAVQVGRSGTALGLLRQVKSPATELVLDPGDCLVFFTDGVTERRRGSELYGADRLRQAVRKLAGHPAAVIAARLRTATLDFSTEPPRDDIAILVLRNDHPLG